MSGAKMMAWGRSWEILVRVARVDKRLWCCVVRALLNLKDSRFQG